MVKFSRDVLQNHPGVVRPTHFTWIRMLKDADGSPDGLTVRKYLEGELHELPSAPLPRYGLAALFIAEGLAEEVSAPNDRKPPTIEEVLVAGYKQEAAESIVAEENRKFAAGEKPYGDKEPTEPVEDVAPVETKAEVVEQPKEMIEEQPKEQPVEEKKPEVVEQPKAEIAESAQPKSKKR